MVCLQYWSCFLLGFLSMFISTHYNFVYIFPSCVPIGVFLYPSPLNQIREHLSCLKLKEKKKTQKKKKNPLR